MDDQADKPVVPVAEPKPRIDPATDPIKNILDKLYDSTLKYMLSNTVPTKVKLGVIVGLYSAITGGIGLIGNLRTPAVELNETTLRAFADDTMASKNVADQCFYEDKSKKLQVTFTESSSLTAVYDMVTSIATVTAYTPPKKNHTLGNLPYITAAPCSVLSESGKIDANTMGLRSREAVTQFMQAVKAGNALKDAGQPRGAYSVTPYAWDPEQRPQ